MPYAFINPSTGNNVPVKKNAAAAGPRPIRSRASQNVVPVSG
jgi:hypothetical protein